MLILKDMTSYNYYSGYCIFILYLNNVSLSFQQDHCDNSAFLLGNVIMFFLTAY